ncbi:MAG: glycosyl transferase [Bacteroidales bacterium]|jgi:mannosyltransferase OCH1-like enzyme|nr:glycosyl transferase [Bacteroidales bacterium]
MIPKKIHFCWISGDPYPTLIQHCIDSWHKYLPDYEFVLWDAKRIETINCDWFQGAMDAKKYGSVADYVRFHALYHEGGIYLDADVEVLKNFDDLISFKSFIGLEQSGYFEAAVIGAEPHLDWIGYVLQQFKNTPFLNENGKMNLQPLPATLNRLLSDYFHCKKNQFENLNSDQLRIFPKTYFSPKNHHTKKIKISKQTYTIHHFDAHWVKKDLKFKVKMFMHQFLIFMFGSSSHQKICARLQKK